MKSERFRKYFSHVLLILIPLILIAMGVFFGHFFSIWHFQSKINRQSQAETLKIAPIKYFSECYRIINEKLPKIKDENFCYVNMAEIFDGEDKDIFIDSYHFGDRGNEKIANKMYEYLRDIILGAI